MLGGVAQKPWRSAPAEAALLGQAPGTGLFADAIAQTTTDAQTAFRLDLRRGVTAEALESASGA